MPEPILASTSTDVQQPGPLLLVIEDDAQIRRFLRAALSSSGYRLLEAGTAKDGMRILVEDHPDLILLDLGLPDLDGVEFTRQVREWTQIPIVVLSARERENDKVTALDSGADDYLTKPIRAGELMARLRVALRHAQQVTQGVEEPIFEIRELRVDMARRQVFIKNVEIHLTPIEYKLLTTLARHAGKVVTGHQLLMEVWGPKYTRENHYVRVYMGQLRRKLEDDATRPQYIITEPGIGYRLRVE
jgi:two-component system KDP operon response regulator KdpE